MTQLQRMIKRWEQDVVLREMIIDGVHLTAGVAVIVTVVTLLFL